MIEAYPKQLCFDDILMVPQHSTVMSRRDIDLSMNIGNRSILNLPVVGSPMDTVCEAQMAITLAKAGGIGIIHRFMPLEKLLDQISYVARFGYAVGAAIGAKENVESNSVKLVDAGASLILIDTANGHSEYAIQAVHRVRDAVGNNIHIMAGNVATSEGFRMLADAGADSIRVGIGGGSMCTTRIISGHGIPTLASVMMCKNAKELGAYDTGIIADGGIRNTGDMIKAFAAGADAVMLGSMLAGTDEAPGDIFMDEFGKYKAFRGMASREANEGKDIPIAEGIATKIKYKGSVENILKDIRGGLGSGCSYSGVDRLYNLFKESMYVEVSPLSSKESQPHGR